MECTTQLSELWLVSKGCTQITETLVVFLIFASELQYLFCSLQLEYFNVFDLRCLFTTQQMAISWQRSITRIPNAITSIENPTIIVNEDIQSFSKHQIMILICQYSSISLFWFYIRNNGFITFI